MPTAGVGSNQYQSVGASTATSSRASVAGVAAALMNDVTDAPTDEGPRETFRIPEHNMDKLKKDIDRLAKRAAKLGVPPPTLTIEDTITEIDPKGLVHLAYQVRVGGEPPKFDGWRFVASVDLDPADDSDINVVGAIPGEIIDPEWRTITERCDHCHVSNRGRKKLIVTEHDDGTRQVVGSTCLKDFLGHGSPQGIAAWAEIMTHLDDVARGYSGEGYTYDGAVEHCRLDPTLYLESVASIIRQDGWKPRSARRHDTIPTADVAFTAIVESPDHLDDGGFTPPNDEDRQLVAEALEWAQTGIELGRSDYLDNLAAVTQKSSWRHRDLGIAASLITAYQRELGKQTENQRRQEERSGSAHVGKVGERIKEFSGTVTQVNSFDGAYGTTSWVELLGSDGNIYSWKTNSQIPERGEQLVGAVSVKGHDEYLGTARTVITRPRWK